jgi:hypothetical protein
MQSYGAAKSRESQLWQFRDSHLRVLRQNAIWMWVLVYYKGEGGAFPQVRAVVSLMSPSLPVAHPSTKSVQIMH